MRDSLSLVSKDYENYDVSKDQETLNTYLRAIGFPCAMTLTPTVETLHIILSNHIMRVPYSNFHFHYKERIPLDFSFSGLV